MTHGCGALIYSAKTNRYLFLLRDKTKHAGSWGIVGGKIEDGETVIDGLVREINEEIGMDFSSGKFIPLETFTAETRAFVYHTFLHCVDEEFVPLLNAEHRGYCWVHLDDHPRPLHPGLWRSFNFDIVKTKIKTLESILNPV